MLMYNLASSVLSQSFLWLLGIPGGSVDFGKERRGGGIVIICTDRSYGLGISFHGLGIRCNNCFPRERIVEIKKWDGEDEYHAILYWYTR